MQKKKLVVLSGAGMSAESGLKTFRDSGGLWEGYNVYEVATPEGWAKDPAQVLDFYNQRRRDVQNAHPNKAHLAIAQLEKKFDVTVVTQNIDDLHERAGSTHVIHLHGEILKMRSSKNETLIYPCNGEIQLGEIAEDGAQLRPHVVWFGEAIPMMEKAVAEAMQADVFLIIGTSLNVYPAAGLIDVVKPEATKYVIDPHLPEMYPYPNLITIEKTATEGMEELKSLLQLP